MIPRPDYLHSCVSTRRQRVRVPETPMHLDAILVDEDLTVGSNRGSGRAHLRTLTIMGFPVADLAGFARRTQPARLPYRWSSAGICLDTDRRDQGARRIRRRGSPSANRSWRS